jgi:DNA replication protein DnaC
MTKRTDPPGQPPNLSPPGENPSLDNPALRKQLEALKMLYCREHFEALACEAAQNNWDHIGYFSRLIEGEAAGREDRCIARRIKLARFPVIKTLEQFQWSWPTKINRAQIQNLFRLSFIEEKLNPIFLGGVGVGKSHLSIALAHAACLRGHSVLFTTAIDIINTLAAAHSNGSLKRAMQLYIRPRVLLCDELGYLPVDKRGADLLFQIISARYERGSTIVTSNRVYKSWSEIFNNDSTLTSALLDRLLHHSETVLIEGRSFRTREKNETPA